MGRGVVEVEGELSHGKSFYERMVSASSCGVHVHGSAFSVHKDEGLMIMKEVCVLVLVHCWALFVTENEKIAHV